MLSVLQGMRDGLTVLCITLMQQVMDFSGTPFFPAATALIGAVLGAFLNQTLIGRREKTRTQEVSKSVRKILKLEIDHNLTEMKGLSGKVSNNIDLGGITDIRLGLSKVNFLKVVFDSLISDIPRALSHEEVKAIYQMYAAVDRTKAVKNTYQDLAPPPKLIPYSIDPLELEKTRTMREKLERELEDYKELSDLLDEAIYVIEEFLIQLTD